jgi:hypothetical protein
LMQKPSAASRLPLFSMDSRVGRGEDLAAPSLQPTIYFPAPLSTRGDSKFRPGSKRGQVPLPGQPAACFPQRHLTPSFGPRLPDDVKIDTSPRMVPNPLNGVTRDCSTTDEGSQNYVVVLKCATFVLLRI